MLSSTAVQSPRGVEVTLWHRDDTSDLATIGSTFRLWGDLHDEYGLANIYSSGHLIDIGAHIGSVCIAFLLDNREARATAIEPLPENIEVLRHNASAAGVQDRLTIVEGAIGTTTVNYGLDVHRFIGNIAGSAEARKVKRVKLADYLPADIVKLDCEGCEYGALKALKGVRIVLGEYHFQGPEAITAALEKTHEVMIDATPTGNFRAVAR